MFTGIIVVSSLYGFIVAYIMTIRQDLKRRKRRIDFIVFCG